MIDKQIIIDEQMENLNNLATQQLKRIEEEKKQIEHIAKTHLVETFDMQREIDKLKKELQAKEQECEELKDKLNCCFCNPYVELNDTEKQRKCVEVTECFRRQLDQLKAENKHLNDLLNQALKELEKTRETLTEIKEIAKNGCYDDCGMPLDELSIILQKISECEVE